MSKNWNEMDKEDRFSTLISSLNHEVKNVVLWKTVNGTPRKFIEIVETFENMFPKVLPPRQDAIQSYFSSTFIPMGFVTRVGMQDKSLHWDKWIASNSGNLIGKPCAAHAIKIASEYDSSLHDILGRSKGKGETTAPYNTARVMKSLRKGNNQTISELSLGLDLPGPVITKTMLRLKDAGFANFSTVNNETGSPKFMWSGGNIERLTPLYGTRQLTKMICDIVSSSHEYFEYSDISGRIKEMCGIEYNTNSIKNALLNIERQGFIERKGKLKHNVKMSNASLTQLGYSFLEDFIDPIERTSVDMKVDSVVRKSLELYLNPKVFSQEVPAAMKLHRSTTSYTNMAPGDKTDGEIISLLQKGPMRFIEINTYFDKDIVGSLRRLMVNGKISKTKEGISVYYQLV